MSKHTIEPGDALLATNLHNLKQTYCQIKKRCLFQKIFSTYLLLGFFVLQYSVPIFLVVLGSITTTSREQLGLFVQKRDVPTQKNENNSNSSKPNNQLDEHKENLVSKIIFLLGLTTILLGVLNNIVRPAESYDESAEFNNKLYKFEIDFDLEIVKLGGITKSSEAQQFNSIIKLFLEKNQELSKLIDEYNKARSLQNRTADIELLKQEIDELKRKDSGQGGLTGGKNSVVPTE